MACIHCITAAQEKFNFCNNCGADVRNLIPQDYGIGILNLPDDKLDYGKINSSSEVPLISDLYSCKENDRGLIICRIPDKYPNKTKDPAFYGFLFMAIWCVLYFIDYATYYSGSYDPDLESIISLYVIGIRVVAALLIGKYAKRKNRRQGGWFLFSLLTPSIALIALGYSKKKRVAFSFHSNSTDIEKVNQIDPIAQKLDIQYNKYEKAVLYYRLYELDQTKLDELYTAAILFYELDEQEYAKDLLNELIKQGFKKGEVYYYLGLIESNHFNLINAVEYWKTSFKMGYEKSKFYLDKYFNFHRIYVNDEIQIARKLGDLITEQPIKITGFIFPDLEQILDFKSENYDQLHLRKYGLEFGGKSINQKQKLGVSFYEVTNFEVIESKGYSVKLTIDEPDVCSFEINKNSQGKRMVDQIIAAYGAETNKIIS